MRPTYITRAQRTLDTTRLALPARTGGRIGANRRRKHPLPAWASMAIAAACMVAFAIACAVLTSLTTNP